MDFVFAKLVERFCCHRVVQLAPAASARRGCAGLPSRRDPAPGSFSAGLTVPNQLIVLSCGPASDSAESRRGRKEPTSLWDCARVDGVLDNAAAVESDSICKLSRYRSLRRHYNDRMRHHLFLVGAIRLIVPVRCRENSGQPREFGAAHTTHESGRSSRDPAKRSRALAHCSTMDDLRCGSGGIRRRRSSVRASDERVNRSGGRTEIDARQVPYLANRARR